MPEICAYKYLVTTIIYRYKNMSDFDPTSKAERVLAPIPARTPTPPVSANPLAGFFRQPKIWISLPSKGKFYSEGSLEKTETGEFPVFDMTARDELLFKTPDALMNGSATVEVVKSCIPNIKDPWAMPSIDIDAVLIAIRIATYGVEMDVTAQCPSCSVNNDFAVDLRNVLDGLNQATFNEKVEIGSDMLVSLRPLTYKQTTQTALKAFEHQRIFTIVNDEKLSEQDKIKMFQESFIKLTDITIESAANCVHKIESVSGSTDDPEYIKEFLSKADKAVFQTVNDAINKSTESGTMSKFHATCQSCKHEWDVTLTMDQSDFFGQGFRR